MKSLRVLFLAGLGIGLVMVMHSQLTFDQHLMLGLGRELLAGAFPSFGMPTSAGGRSPGGVTSLLVAGPLLAWDDPRAVALSTLLLHAAAFLLLAWHVKSVLDRAGLVALLAVGWLSPWHLYFASHIWNANYMYVFAVLHLLSCLRLARESTALDSALHMVLIGVALQVHTSAFVLMLASGMLYWRGDIRVNMRGALAGALVTTALYVPWWLALRDNPHLVPGGRHFPMWSLVNVQPFLKGMYQTVRMASLAVAERMLGLDFTRHLGVGVNSWLRPVGLALGVLAHATLLVALHATWRQVLRGWRSLRLAGFRLRATPRPLPRTRLALRGWLRRYVIAMLVALLAAFAASPTTPMWWQAFVVLPAAALGMALYADSLSRTRLAHAVPVGLRAWTGVALVLSLLMAFGAPMYR